jgi:hypothetical protein
MKSERQLRDEIRLREASLDDARRELAAGELAEQDVAAITQREETALAVARRALEELVASSAREESSGSPASPATPSRRRRRSRLIVALGCFALAAVVLVWLNLGLRQAGQSATGGLSLSQTEKVQELSTDAEVDIADGDAVAALSAYDQILAIQPTNVAALTEAGWLEFSAGSNSHNATVVANGVADLAEAVTLAPRSPAPRLYYAIVADSTAGNTALAKGQFTTFLTLHPSKAQLATAAPFLHELGLAS